MSDRADNLSQQAPTARLADLQVVQFISDALRAGQRAILVTGRGEASVRVPEAALAAYANASARILHIGPPLPEPPELQEMIGAAVDIAGSRDIAPIAMAARLLFPDRRQTIILAIDDAHTLSHPSLSYLTLITELLAPDAPVLQIVLAAEPVLLDTLAQPEYETFRNRLCQPGFEASQTLPAAKDDRVFSRPQMPVSWRAAPGQTHVQYAEPMAAYRTGHGFVRSAVRAAAWLVAIGGIAAIGYIAFSDFSVDPNTPSAVDPNTPSALPVPRSLESLLPEPPGGSGPHTLGDPAQPTLAPLHVVLDVARDAKTTTEAAPPAGSPAGSEVEPSAADENCQRDQERLEQLRIRPSFEQAERFDSELRCEKLRYQLLELMKTMEPLGPAPAPEVSNGLAAAKTTFEAAGARPLAGSEVEPSAPDEICKRDAERLERLRNAPSFEQAERFDSELRCETLRPQLQGLMASLSPLAPAPAPAGSNGLADAKTTTEAPGAGPWAGSVVEPSAPDEICKRDAERLEWLRNAPSFEQAERFDSELRCETLRPQLRGLMASLSPQAPAPEVSNGLVDVKTTTEPPGAGPVVGSEVARSAPDEICNRDEERLEQLRSRPSSDEAARFDSQLRCEKLRPQLLRLMESLGYEPSSASQGPSVGGMPALGAKAASDCVSDQDRLNRIRAQPSAATAQQFWRDLQCERLRPQVRLLLESLNVGAGPTGACQREAEELHRIRTTPTRREAESFAQAVTCDALKPQAKRLLESLAE